MLLPLGCSLVASNRPPGSVALAVAVLSGFLAHESARVLLGRRGSRARRDDAGAAELSMTLFGAVAVGASLQAWSALGVPDARWALAIPAALTVLAAAASIRGLERTVSGETLTAAALACWSVPIMIAGGRGWAVGLANWGVWLVMFTVATCGVHVVIARTRREPIGAYLASGLGLMMLGLAGGGVAVALGARPPAFLAAFVAPAVVLATAAHPALRAARLRQVGWAIVAGSLLTGTVLVLT